MGTSLNGLTPANTYQALIKVGNNTNLNTTLKTLSDGAGNDLPMQASTTGINFTGTVSGVASGVSGAIQFSNGSAFASDASNFFWDNTNKRLGVGTNAPTETLDVNGQIRTRITTGVNILGAGSVGLNDAHIFLNQTQGAEISYGNNGFCAVGGDNQIGGNTTIASTVFRNGYVSLGARLGVRGSGSTSATTSLLVQNSSGDTNLIVTDDQIVKGYAGSSLRFRFGGNSTAGISTRNGALCVGIIDAGFSSGLQISADSASGKTFIDGWNDGGSNQYDIVIGNEGSRTQFGTNSASVSSAQVAINSTTRGFLPPRMTTTQKNAIATPATGLQVFDSTMNATCEYTGTAWRVVSAGAQAVTVTGLLQTVSLADGNVLNITLNSTTTFTFTNPTIGTYILKLTQGVGGGFLVNWPVNVIWSGGTAPTLSTTAGKIDIITLIYDGTSYYGNYSLNY